LRIIYSAASQLSHPEETTIESDASLLALWGRRSSGAQVAEDDLPTGRMIAAVQFRMQRKQAVSNTRIVAAGELDTLSGTTGGWEP
jgi:hypothetical protein